MWKVRRLNQEKRPNNLKAVTRKIETYMYSLYAKLPSLHPILWSPIKKKDLKIMPQIVQKCYRWRFLSIISNFVCNRMLETKIKQDFVEQWKT